MRMIRNAAPVVIWVAFGVNIANGGPLFFTDESSFNSAIGGASLSLESFESPFATGTSVNFTDLTVTGDQNLFQTSPSTLATDGVSTIGIIDFNFNGNVVTFTFSSAINAFSLDVLNANDFRSGGNLTLSNDNGSSQVLYSGLLPSPNTAFVGLVDDMTSFRSVTVHTTLTGDGIQYDRLRYGLVNSDANSPIPEPSTVLFLATGLCAFTCLRLRKVNRPVKTDELT